MTPAQFSLAVAAVALLAAGAAFLGYTYGRSTVPAAAPAPYSPESPASALPGPAPVPAAPAPPEAIPVPPASLPAATLPAATPPPSPASAPGTPARAPAGEKAAAVPRLMIQVASVRAEGEAKRLLSSLGEAGYRGRIVPVRLSTGTWYRVQVGPFAGMSEAQAALEAISRRKGLKGFVVRP